MGRSVKKFSSCKEKKHKKHHDKKKKKKNKRKREEPSSSNSSPEREKKKHKMKKKKKHSEGSDEGDHLVGPEVPPELAQAVEKRAPAPMTKEEWEKKQNVLRRVYDEESGRHRLIRGDGEIVEEIVSKNRHKEINRQATLGDGEYFQSVLSKKIS